ncbi:23 kDa integral membrane protein [Dermatophagoides farinae]|uniref:Tetraspanin n=1 Tax=Dermatophagoides farinae TaxID=6954 RepID=A0A922I9D2_DERFA|nr:leukocyte surface antigen CD53-like [Dermatophagoides farinae]KAH7640966.1 tetraspanin-like protein 3 [Dermatophagoides farinae]KAH9526603.1 Tetraspanin-2 [Dermatophagoides farinae]
MAKTCGASVIKLALIIINLVFLVLGCVVIYVGYNLVDINIQAPGAFTLADINFKSISWVVLATGVIIVLIAAFGFFGSCCESSAMLNLYGFLLIALIAAQIYVVVRSIKSNDNIEEKIRTGILDAINKMNNNTKTKLVLQEIQSKLKCCGWNGVSDYKKEILASCCDQWKDGDDPGKLCDGSSYEDGCKSKFEFLTKYLGSSTAIGIVAILIQLVLIFAACCLARDF